MVSRSLRGHELFAAAAFVASVFLLALQLLNPSPVVVTVDGATAETAKLPGLFTRQDVLVMTLAACVLGASSTYLLTGRDTKDSNPTPTAASPTTDGGAQPSEDLLEARREEWAETAERLANSEREVYETVLDADGVLEQREIADRTDLSKATVSRSLDSLETKRLVERKQRGMGNVVMLQ